MDHQNQQDLILHGRSGGFAPAPPHATGRFEGAGEEDGSQALLAYLRLLRRNLLLVSLSALAGLALGLGVALMQTPVYQARAALEIERPNDRFLDLENLMPTTLDEPYSIDSELATQIRILTSRPLVASTIERLDAASELESKPGLKDRLLGAAPLSAEDAALAALHVEPSGLSRIVDVYFEHSDPEFAARFSNGLAEEFIRQSIENRWQAAERTAKSLSGELSETRRQLAEMQTKLQETARNNGVVALAGGSTLAEERLRQIQDDLARAQSERIVNQARWEQARELAPRTAAATLDSQALRDHELQLADLRVQLNALTTKFKPGYSGVKSLRAQIDFLEEKLEAERNEILRRAQSQYEAAAKREEMIAAQHRLASGVVAVQKARAIEFDLLRQEAETSRQLYDNLLRKIKESTVAATIGAAHIRVVDPAAAPPNPVRPNPLLSSGLGLVLGGLVGLVLAGARSRGVETMLTPGDIPRLLGTPELACIPMLKASEERLVQTAGRLSLGEGEPVGLGGDPLAATSYQDLMTSLLLKRRPGSPQVLVVSSPREGDGKSTTVYNLAVSLATSGERVLVVDGDLRHPVQHELFGLSQRTGLGDVLEVGADEDGTLGADEARRSDEQNLELVAEGALEGRHPDFRNLHLITAGIAPSHAARLLHSRGFAAALMHRFHQFDVVLIDTPAVLDDPDARIFARIADAVALVVRASTTSLEEAEAARDRFSSDRTPIAGAVLNGCERGGARSRGRLASGAASPRRMLPVRGGTTDEPSGSRARTES